MRREVGILATGLRCPTRNVIKRRKDSKKKMTENDDRNGLQQVRKAPASIYGKAAIII